MHPISDAETFTLLLRDLFTGPDRVAVISGKEGSLDALALAAFFAGLARDHFPGGIYLAAPQLTELDVIASELFDSSLGKSLLIISDSNFGDTYSFAIDRFTRTWEKVSLIVLARNAEWVTGHFFIINLSNGQSSASPITKLYDRNSSFDEGQQEGQIQDN